MFVTPVGDSAPMNPTTTAPKAVKALQHVEIPVGDTVPCQASKSPQQKASHVMPPKAKGSKAKTPKKTPQKNLPTNNEKNSWEFSPYCLWLWEALHVMLFSVVTLTLDRKQYPQQGFQRAVQIVEL